MKITLTIDADISAEEIVKIMEQEAKQQKERDEAFNNRMPPTIFGTVVEKEEAPVPFPFPLPPKKNKPN